MRYQTEGEFPDCGCHYTTDDDGIHFCPMHKASQELLDVAKEVLVALDVNGCHADALKLRAVINKAEGR